MKIETYIDSLVSYAMNCGLAEPEDHTVLLNRILDILSMDAYAPSDEPQSEDLEEILGGLLGVDPIFALENLYKLMDRVLAKAPLREHGVTLEELPVFAKNVLETQQRLLGNNYAELTEKDILSIYEKAF